MKISGIKAYQCRGIYMVISTWNIALGRPVLPVIWYTRLSSSNCEIANAKPSHCIETYSLLESWQDGCMMVLFIGKADSFRWNTYQLQLPLTTKELKLNILHLIYHICQQIPRHMLVCSCHWIRVWASALFIPFLIKWTLMYIEHAMISPASIMKSFKQLFNTN